MSLLPSPVQSQQSSQHPAGLPPLLIKPFRGRDGRVYWEADDGEFLTYSEIHLRLRLMMACLRFRPAPAVGRQPWTEDAVTWVAVERPWWIGFVEEPLEALVAYPEIEDSSAVVQGIIAAL